jgi:CysZ protein
MNGNLIAGAKYFWRGMRLIWQPGVRSFTLWPIFITSMVFIGLIWLGTVYFDVLLEHFLPSGESWWETALHYLLWPIFALTLLLVWYFTFTVVANLIGAPFNGFLAERVESHLRGEKPRPVDSSTFIGEILPSLFNEIVKLAYFLLWVIPLLLLFVIPVLNLAAPFLWALFMAWMLALEYTEYPMDNHGMRFKAVRERLRKRRLSALGFGGLATLCMLVPLLNLLVMPAAVAGATVFWIEELQEIA